jgi:hypothetical protein
MSHIHWVARGTGTPKDKDEVYRQEVCEWMRTELNFVVVYLHQKNLLFIINRENKSTTREFIIRVKREQREYVEMGVGIMRD